LVGVDAGGTSTRALAFDASAGVSREGAAEGANWTVHGPAVCAARICAAVGSVTGGVRIRQLALCVAGYYPPDHAEAAAAWARETWPGTAVRLEPDYLAAWYGAHGGEAGVVVIAGTGSVAYGRNEAGRETRAGGWGPLYGDEGSAYWVGVEFLRWLAHRDDLGQPDDEATAAVRARWPELGSDRRAWLRGVYRVGWGREEIAALGGEVGRAADAGQSQMANLIGDSAAKLVQLAGRVNGRLWTPADAGATPVCLQGGLAHSCERLRRSFATELEIAAADAAHRRMRLVEAVHSPVAGALLLAAAAADLPLPEVRAALG
jgi:glucosamine kinase